MSAGGIIDALTISRKFCCFLAKEQYKKKNWKHYLICYFFWILFTEFYFKFSDVFSLGNSVDKCLLKITFKGIIGKDFFVLFSIYTLYHFAYVIKSFICFL